MVCINGTGFSTPLHGRKTPQRAIRSRVLRFGFMPSVRVFLLGLATLFASPLHLLAQDRGAGGNPLASGGFQPGQWTPAHATFYGDESAQETMGGACGYGNLLATGYGLNTAALSTSLFNQGLGCGTCYEIKCQKDPSSGADHCLPGYPVIKITATNLCPPNYAQADNAGGWCNHQLQHFDMSKPAFMQIADWHAGIVPVSYRRVPCDSQTGFEFLLQGNAYWLLVYVMHVGGAGDIGSLAVKGSKTGWITMSHNWGATYQAFSALGGQSLSFKITSLSTPETVIAWDVAPQGWQVGMTYQASVNFQP